MIFIDELDSIAPRRDEVVGEVERRVVAQLLTLMDGLSGRGNVIVIAATNREEAIDPALRRPGRFDREIEIGVPTVAGRLEILQIHTRGMPIEGTEKDRDRILKDLAALSHGFVGADLAALGRESAMRALRRYLPEIDFDKPIPLTLLERMKVTERDFKEALKQVEPSSLRDVTIEIPTTRWDEVGGLDSVRQALQETVELPIKNPEAYRHLGVEPPRGILLYGPPGVGKTLLAKAAATESQANFISVKGPEIMSKWVGESEKAVRVIFKKARQASPAIVFIDEIDSIAPKRGLQTSSGVTERIVNQLLTSIDGLESLERVVVLAATNRPDILDEALLRTGRFDRLLYVEPPKVAGRLEILKVHTRKMPLDGVRLAGPRGPHRGVRRERPRGALPGGGARRDPGEPEGVEGHDDPLRGGPEALPRVVRPGEPEVLRGLRAPALPRADRPSEGRGAAGHLPVGPSPERPSGRRTRHRLGAVGPYASGER